MASTSSSDQFICAYCIKDGDASTPAVTAVDGTLLCAEHARIALANHRMRHD